MLDVGCGDGKYFSKAVEAGCSCVGVDASLELLKRAGRAETGPEKVRVCSAGTSHVPSLLLTLNASQSQSLYGSAATDAVGGDCVRLPFKNSYFDAALCVAVMHHLSTDARRVRCFEEMLRVVRVGGRCSVHAWAEEQEDGSRRKFGGQDVMVPFNARMEDLTQEDVELGEGSVVEGKGLVEFEVRRGEERKTRVRARSEAMKRCKFHGEERRGADNDARTRKYDVQRLVASLVTVIFSSLTPILTS